MTSDVESGTEGYEWLDLVFRVATTVGILLAVVGAGSFIYQTVAFVRLGAWPPLEVRDAIQWFSAAGADTILPGQPNARKAVLWILDGPFSLEAACLGLLMWLLTATTLGRFVTIIGGAAMLSGSVVLLWISLLAEWPLTEKTTPLQQGVPAMGKSGATSAMPPLPEGFTLRPPQQQPRGMFDDLIPPK